MVGGKRIKESIMERKKAESTKKHRPPLLGADIEKFLKNQIDARILAMKMREKNTLSRL